MKHFMVKMTGVCNILENVLLIYLEVKDHNTKFQQYVLDVKDHKNKFHQCVPRVKCWK